MDFRQVTYDVHVPTDFIFQSFSFLSFSFTFQQFLFQFRMSACLLCQCLVQQHSTATSNNSNTSNTSNTLGRKDKKKASALSVVVVQKLMHHTYNTMRKLPVSRVGFDQCVQLILALFALVVQRLNLRGQCKDFCFGVFRANTNGIVFLNQLRDFFLAFQ